MSDTKDWTPTKDDDPACQCPSCGSDDVWYRELSGGYEDYAYHCRTCDKRWVAEGSDA